LDIKGFIVIIFKKVVLSVFVSEKTVSVIITVLNDKRIERTIRSILDQSYLPDEIFVADGGSDDGTWELILDFKEKYGDIINPQRLEGNITTTRNKALPLMEGNIIVFIDADEVAPKNWLECLINPILNGEANFTGGPTKPYIEPISKVEKYVNRYDDFFFENVVSKDISMVPMGNTAWDKKIFSKIGGFDERIKWGGEDYDINLRALENGFQGKLVKDAWVWHDQSRLNSLGKIIRKKYTYATGATIAYLKRGGVGNKVGKSAKTSITYFHPIELISFFMKPLAFLRGYLIYRKYVKQSIDKNSESENS